MKSQNRVVVIGGGVVGASVLYHLAKMGWSEIALIERSVLTAGSSWHAAGGVHALNADPNIAALQAYTIKLLPEIEKESGQNIGLHMTGGVNFAAAPERWEWLQHAYRVFQTMGIDSCRLVGPEEIKEMLPVIDIAGVLGGLHDANEGHVDPSGVVHAYAIAARKMGAAVVEHNRVLELNPRGDRCWEVVTEQGTVIAGHVVNAGGLWAKQCGRMVGIDLPVTPLEHHYLVTETIPEVAALERELPFGIDLEGYTYMRQEGQGMLLGIYETSYQHWNMDGAPWDYGIELIQEDIGRIAGELEKGFARYPCLAEAGIKRWVNGAFTFTPDGNPLVGPVPGVPNYWAACGVMAGFLQGGGGGARCRRIRLQRHAVDADREELRHLVEGVHPRVYRRRDQHGPLDRLGQGRFHWQTGRSGGARGRPGAPPGDPGGGRAGRRCRGLRAGLAGRVAGRFRHLGRLWPLPRKVAGDGAGRARAGGAGNRAHGACGWRRAGGAGAGAVAP